MKNLKYFESSSNDEFNELFNIDKEEILEHFIDISDNGWEVRVNLVKKLITVSRYKSEDGRFELHMVPHISVTITNVNEAGQLLGLYKSNEFREILEIASNRLNDINLYLDLNDMKISRNSIVGINIYRNIDKKTNKI